MFVPRLPSRVAPRWCQRPTREAQELDYYSSTAPRSGRKRHTRNAKDTKKRGDVDNTALHAQYCLTERAEQEAKASLDHALILTPICTITKRYNVCQNDGICSSWSIDLPKVIDDTSPRIRFDCTDWQGEARGLGQWLGRV